MKHQIINKGRMWHVIERTTGKTRAFSTTYTLAKAKCEALDKKGDAQ